MTSVRSTSEILEADAIAPFKDEGIPLNGTVARFIANTGYGGFRGVVLFVNTLVVTPILIFGLGKEQFGILALATPFLRYGFNGVFDLGLATGLVRFFSRDFAAHDHESINRYFASGLLLYCLAGVSILTLFPLLSSSVIASVLGLDARMRATVTTALWMLLGIYALLLLSNPFFALLMGVQKVHLSHIVGTVSLLTELVGVLILLPFGITMSRVIVVYGVGATLSTALCVYLTRRSFPSLCLRVRNISHEKLHDLIHYTARWSVTVSTSVLSPVIDKLILARFAGLSFVAIYEAAAKLVDIPKRATQLLLLPVFPMAGAMAPIQSEEQRQSFYRRIFSANLAIDAALYLIPATLAFEITRAWLGPELSGLAGRTLVVLLVTGFLLALVTPAALILAGTGRMRLLVTAGLGALSLNLSLSVYLAKQFGLWGVLAGTAIAYGGQSIYILASLQRRKDFSLAVGQTARAGLVVVSSAVVPGLLLTRTYGSVHGFGRLVIIGALSVLPYCLVLFAFEENRRLAASIVEPVTRAVKGWTVGKRAGEASQA